MAAAMFGISNTMTAYAASGGLRHCKTTSILFTGAIKSNTRLLSTISTAQSKTHTNHTLITPSSVSVSQLDSSRQHQLVSLPKQPL